MLQRKILSALRIFYRNYSARKQFVLGIESSCDDTGAAIVDESRNVLGESLASQMKIHLE